MFPVTQVNDGGSVTSYPVSQVTCTTSPGFRVSRDEKDPFSGAAGSGHGAAGGLRVNDRDNN